MPSTDILIKGAREHNLRNVDVILPRNKLICMTGVSGSGKSSLAFDTLYAEGQRRYVESLSTFARQFLGQMPKPEVDFIGGLSPSISISQKSTGSNPRSTVGTVTEIHDYLRVLFARVGQGHCPQCDREITAQSREQIIGRILTLPANTKFAVLAPIIRRQKGEYRDLFVDLLKQGFVRARVDGQTVSLSDNLKLDRQMRHDIEVVVDRLQIKAQVRGRLAEAVELALKAGKGTLIVELSDEGSSPPRNSDSKDSDSGDSSQIGGGAVDTGDSGEGEESGREKASRRGGSRANDIVFSIDYACTHCGISFEPPSPQLFSFNSPQGMCLQCDGLGEFYSFDPDRLISDPGLSFRQGCFELIGPWKEMGRWRRHIYQGVADSVERLRALSEGTLLDTPWRELPAELQDVWLSGTGDRHITFTWRGGASPIKYGGRWDGIVPDLLGRYRTSKSIPQRRQLEKYMRTLLCPSCRGERLNDQARAVRLTTAHPRFAASAAKSLPEVSQLAIGDAVEFFSELQLDPTRRMIAAEVLKEVLARLGFLLNVGLDYLSLARTAPTLSGGETQRIRLAGQIGSGLVGVLYILDEPSIGLHPRDNHRLLDTLRHLRDMGNTVVVVEHDEDTMRAADHLVDFGPGPGVRGGEVVASGPLADVLGEPRSVTGRYLSGRETIEVPARRRPLSDKRLRVFGAAHNNLKQIDVDIPLGAFVCVTGVSGSGKSSLVNDILVEALLRDLNGGEGRPGSFRRMEGLESLDKMIAIDQSPIGRTPRSNPGTYIKVFDDIRHLFSQLPASKLRGYEPGRFSFNVSGGRCEACEGNGSNKLEMDFLADVWVTCPVCFGHRYNRETLQVKFKDKSIAEVLEMDIQQLIELFENIHAVRHKLQTLHDVGLDYVKLGQPSPTLSGGEAQRIKLAKELVKKSTGRTLYLLDEPTTGLHFADIKLLLKVLHDFVNAGNTVLVVEHNLDVIKTADWLIDLGPEGGGAGGRIVAVGTPEQVAQVPASYTGQALRRCLKLDSGIGKRPPGRRRRSAVPDKSRKTDLVVRGASQHNLKGVDVTIARDQMTVFCGPSGSGKSSLAMDTIYAEGQRRYVESLSSYARQFVSQMQKPQLDHIDGLSPAIAIEQKNVGHTPRSTVGTVTEIYDYLRVLYARLGEPHCPACEIPIGTQTVDEILDKMLAEPAGTRMYLMAPVEVAVGDEYEPLWSELKSAGYARVRIDGETHALDNPPEIDRRRKHEVLVIVDRIAVRESARSRIADSLETALALGKGVIQLAYAQEDTPESKWRVVAHSQHLACGNCGRSFERLSPHNFSFNSQLGWCLACEGLGVQTGANPAALLRDPKLTLSGGALNLWPDLQTPIARLMLEAFCRGTGIPLDVPFDKLAARHRRMVLHGTGEQWFDLATKARGGANEDDSQTMFRFQFKGLYPALEDASRLSPSFRARLAPFVGDVECTTCNGSRLRDDAAAVRFRGRAVDELCRMPLGELQRELDAWKLPSRDRKIVGELLREIGGRVQFLNDVGLDYLTLGRGAATLSNGEAQRIRLGSQLGSGLCGVLYVLDEPTIGLHPRDNTRLLRALHKLRDLGNTLIVVEHDREVIAGADQICDFGPGAGKHGGHVVAQGPPRLLGKKRGSVTGPYLNGKKAIPVPSNRRMSGVGGTPPAEQNGRGKSLARMTPPAAAVSPPGGGWLEIRGARHNNLKNVDVRIPLGTLTAVTGPSGSGKSSLVEDVLYNAVARTLHRAGTVPGAYEEIRGLEIVNKVIRVDQQALGNSPTSNPATYTGVFELIRELFAQLPEAKVRGYTGRRFSFNVPGGRCEACEGNGQKKIEMHFLPDVWVQCETCRGRRYSPETLAVTYHGRSISDVLDMTCGEATQLFENIPKVRRILQTLCDVGLDYLTLGQSAPTLSGGEAQRVKLAAELARPDTGRTLYLLDEPTTGLHFDDLVKLLEVLQRLVDLGNTVVVIEHNLDVIKTADWVIDMGPEAGERGGEVVVVGTPEDLARFAQAAPGTTRAAPGTTRAADDRRSHTGEALAPVLAGSPRAPRVRFDPAALQEKRAGDLDIADVGRDAKMPWQIDGRGWHTRDRVGRNGEACRWDGRILDRVVDRIHELGDFSDTNWDARSVVEISAKRKSDGWFFHAITGETWLLKMKFRAYHGTFQRDKLIDALSLKTLNQLDEVPVYGNEPRVKVRAAHGPWQEVEIRAHTWEEIDTPEFWEFIEQAVSGFFKFTERAAANLEDLTPWKVLGQKWHFLRKGFPLNKAVRWNVDVWDALYQILCRALPTAQFLWNNQQVVRVYAPGDPEPWASVWTKRPEALVLELAVPKGTVALGRVTGLGCDRELDGARPDRDFVKLKFRTLDDLREGELAEFLGELRGVAGPEVR